MTDVGSPKGIVALAVAIAGSTVAGEYAAIVFCALAGSLWAVGDAQTPTRLTAAWLLLRLVLAAVVLTAPLAWAVESQFGLSASKALAPVAFSIGAVGHRWKAVLADLWARYRLQRFGPKDPV